MRLINMIHFWSLLTTKVMSGLIISILRREQSDMSVIFSLTGHRNIADSY